VEQALTKWGAPVYVRHEIVHNAHVVKRLEAMGAIFVEELSECPDDRRVVFSAHGVPKVVPAEAARRQMTYVDATCPLVSKVHAEAQRLMRAMGCVPLLIGHEGHGGGRRHDGTDRTRVDDADRDGGGCRSISSPQIRSGSPMSRRPR